MPIVMYISQSSYFPTSKCALFEHFSVSLNTCSSLSVFSIEDYAQTPFLLKHLDYLILDM